MIILDISETKERNITSIEGCELSTVLEEYTGADMMISTSGFPATTEVLIKKHIENGALLIQIKHGNDLISSLGDRLAKSISKMRKTGAYQYQCVLLYTGTFTKSSAGNVIVNDYKTDVSYINYVMSLDTWHDRGGVTIHLENSDILEEYSRSREKSLEKHMNDQYKKVYELPLQSVEIVSDWRTTLATFPLIGEKRADSIQNTLLKLNLGNQLIDALKYITDTKRNTVSGLGKSIHISARAWLGLPEGWDLDITPSVQLEVEQQSNQRFINQ